MPRTIKVGSGSKLRCKGWRQEGILRTLENAVATGTKPDELITYAGNAKVARSWECFEDIVQALLELEDDETLIVQSGKPVLVTKTHPLMSRVLHCNCLLLPKWDNPETLHQLEEKGLTMYGSIAGASWEWDHNLEAVGIGMTLKSFAEQHFGGTMEGRMFFSAGLGGAGVGQPVGCKAIDGVCIIVEADKSRLRHIKDWGAYDFLTDDLDKALELSKEALGKKEPLAIALLGNSGQVYPEMVARGVTPDIVTDQTPYDNLPYGIIPAGLSPQEADVMRVEYPEEFLRRITHNAVTVAKSMLKFKERGAIVYDFGTDLTYLATSAGLTEASEIDVYYAEHGREKIMEGREHFIIRALSGDQADADYLDELLLKEFPDDEVIQKEVRLARAIPKLPSGLPATGANLLPKQRLIALTINEMVRNGKFGAPIVFHGGEINVSAADPGVTGGMKDGSDVIADWAHLCAILSAALGADSVTMTGLGTGDCRQARWFTILDGTRETGERVERLLRVDAELATSRWADAGYDEPRKMARQMGIRIPSL